jgi:hypothetical protein
MFFLCLIIVSNLLLIGVDADDKLTRKIKVVYRKEKMLKK